MDQEQEANNRMTSSPVQPVGTDNEATNCSETMSTMEEDYGEMEAASLERARPIWPTTTTLKSSVKNRLGIPRRANISSINCDDIQQSDNNCCYLASTRATELDQDHDQTQDETETTTLSLASGIQAPPSYGTAMRGIECLALDASQLHNTVSSSLIEGQQQPCQMFEHGQYFSVLANEYAGRRIAPIAGTNTRDTKRDSVNLTERTLLSGKTIASSHTLDSRLTSLGMSFNSRQAHPFSLLAGAVNGANNNRLETVGKDTQLTGRYLSSSTSLPRIQLAAHLNADPIPGPSSKHDLGAGQYQINFGLDNNQNSNLNWQQQPQRKIVAPMSGAPINHVISARESMQWQPQTNQYYGAQVALAPENGSVSASANATITPQQAGQSSQAAQESMVMDAQHWTFKDQQSAKATLDHNELTPSQSNFAHYSISNSSNKATMDLSKATHMNNHHQQQHHNQIYTQTTAPLRRSDENLERSSRKQQQVHRKRRRHRSTSGRSMSPAEQSSELRCQPMETNAYYHTMGATYQRHSLSGANSGAALKQTPGALKSRPQSAHKQTISAHCWLIDSSDDQTYTSAAQNKQKVGQVSLNKTNDGQQPTHLTVAIMKQSQQQNQHQKHKQQSKMKSESTSSVSCLVEANKNSTATFKYLTPESQVYGQDLTTNLKTNSLKMERILNRNQARGLRSGCSVRDVATLGKTATTANKFKLVSNRNGNERRRQDNDDFNHKPRAKQNYAVPIKAHRHRLSSGSSSSGSASTQQPHSSAVVRLSALLSFVSNLVKRAPPKCLKVGFSSTSISHDSFDRGHANSISGSVSAPSGSCLAPYTAASLAISSSSSTSAYATGSSHLSSGSNPLLRFVQQPTSINDDGNNQPIVMCQIKAPSKAPSTVGSSMFYSSSGVSGFQMPASSHAYEYCGDDRIGETQFNQDPLRVIIDRNEPSKSSDSKQFMIDNESSDDSSVITDKGENRTKSGKANQKETRLAHMIMSNKELVSTVSDLNTEARYGGLISDHVFAPVVVSGASTVARRRWWLISFKDWLRRPPICNKMNSDSECGGGDHLTQSNQIDAARYKSLRSSSSRRSGRNSNNNTNSRASNSSSTLQNVISLAKADRVFRIRLIASIVVSCILFGLICLLASLIYSRSSSLYQHNNLNLLIDDSDYDISWLWPTQSSSDNYGTRDKNIMSMSPYRILDHLQMKNSIYQIDNSLRSHLLLIEESERLNQFQQTMAHLTSIQLASDNFIDITQLAKHLAPPLVNDGYNRDNNNSNNEVTTSQLTKISMNNSKIMEGEHLKSTKNYISNSQNSKIQLNKDDHDLVSLSLLSNLYWPLVKWRHQNQQSVANFLSFAIPSPSVPKSFSGTQTLRNLLSLLILAESATNLPNSSIQNLNQFIRLNSLLRSSSYHIISCSYLLQRDKIKLNLKGKFCKQLITRYKRMMLTLSQLNHNHLSKLHNSMEPSPIVGDNQQQIKSSSKTLLGFFLDRLALLEVQSLAEATIVVSEESELLIESENFKQVIESILKLDSIISISVVDGDDKWQPKSSLYELTRLVIGEGPMKLNLNLERNQEFQLKFQQFEANHNEAWRELLAKNLLYPWWSFKLPQFISPDQYDLFIHPNLTTKLIMGMVKIEFQLERPTRYIVMNCDKLNLLDITLWLKQSSSIQAHSDHYIGERLSNQTNSATSTLKQIQIRRVLINTKLEQIYIELYDQIEPTTGFVTGDGDQLASEKQSAGLNFGEIPLHDISRRQNHFVINISFNKTSLMTQTNEPKEPGLEFIQYGDYFAQPEAEVKTILYTQFEPSNARRLFPCFDEPQLKAKFQLNLVHEHQHQVLFNAPKRERVPYTSDGAMQMSVFETTQIPLSTYLVSFVVCDSQNIKSITSRVNQLQPTPSMVSTINKFNPSSGIIRQQADLAKDVRHIQIQILSQFEHLSQAEFASQLVPQLLAFYQTHLQFPYPMDKLDLIAIPKSWPIVQADSVQQQQAIQIDTMENMGLIWFKAPLLLVDANLINQNLIEQISMIISHQIAHQYFGNIISIRHWQDLWLYESVCQYLESIALSSVQADWKLEEQFVVTTIQETLVMEQFNGDIDSGQTLGDLLVGATEDCNNDQSANLINDIETSNSMDALASSYNLNLSQVTNLDKIQETNIEIMSPFYLIELKRSSALLHMLLLNLLPSVEAQARLLRRCLNTYRFKTMSKSQFWRQFGNQLMHEASLDRLSLDLSRFTLTSEILNLGESTPLSVIDSDHDHDMHAKWSRPARNLTFEIHDQIPASSEQVIYVRSQTVSRHQEVKEEKDEEYVDVHKIRARSSRLVDNLDLVASAWIDRRGYPLVTASIYRDRLHLRQERFSFAWWNEPSFTGDEPEENEESASRTKWESTRLVNLFSGDSSHLGVSSSKKRAKRSMAQKLVADDIWPIPLMFVSRFNPKLAHFFWMNKRELELPFNTDHLSLQVLNRLDMHEFSQLELRKGHHYPNSWFKLNVNQSSLVRVNYDERNWEALTELLAKSHYSNHILSSLDRANLIDDAITLMRCGKLSVGIAMNLTLYLEVGEREYMPWTSALWHLDQMQTLLNQNPLWHRYVLKLMQPISSVIGWKDDGPHLMRKLRRSLFSVALQYGDDKTVNKAKQEFKGWFKSNRFIVPNLQELVYVAGVRYGDQQEWFHCWQKYQQFVQLDLNFGSSVSGGSNHTLGDVGYRRQSQTLLAGVPSAPPVLGINEQNEPNAENEKRQLLTALASTQNTWLLEQFLNYSLDSTKIQPHHLKHVMQTLGKNPVARLYLWRFVRLNWITLIDRYMPVMNGFKSPVATDKKGQPKASNIEYQVLETMIVESTKHFATKLDYEEVKTFFDGKRRHHQLDVANWSSSVERAIQQSLQVIRSNIYWRDYIEPKLTRWLSHYDSTIIN